MKIAIVGSGKIGGSVAVRLAWAGHEVLFTWAKTPGKLDRAAAVGGGARAGGVEAVRFCDVAVLATRAQKGPN